MTLADAWWTQQQAGLLGGLMGGGLGTLGGLVGAGVGVLAPRGRGKLILVPIQIALCVIGLALLVTGAGAIAADQPYHVYFPLVLSGAILTCVLGGLLPVTLMAYRLAEARQADAGGAGAPQERVTAPGQLSPTVVAAVIQMWGDHGNYRRWCNTIALAAAPIALIGLLWAAVAGARGAGLTSWLPPLVVGGEFALLAMMTAGFAGMARVQVRQLEAFRERQKLDAAEFRRT